MTRRFAAALLWRDFRIDLSYRAPWVIETIGLFSVLAIYYYIVKYTHAFAPGVPGDFFTYIVPGVAMVRFQVGLTRAVATMDREQSSGTLELLFSSPAKAWAVVASASVYELLRSLVMALAVLALGRWVFGASLTLGPRSWVALGLGMMGAAAFFLALTAVACSFLIAFKQGLSVAYVLGTVVPVVSGVYFPPHVLPSFLRGVTSGFPLTLAVDVVRAGVVSASFPIGRVLVMLAATLACLPIAALAVREAVGRARRLGTLGQY